MRLLFLLPLLAALHLSAEEIILSGSYQGEDLYIQNPYSTDGVGFCIFEVLVNGELTSDEVNSSAFAIDFSLFSLKMGAPLEIKLKCKEDCGFKVINPEAIEPKSTFEVSEFANTGNQTLEITTIKESGSLYFILEQFKWNKWVEVDKFLGNGNYSVNTYLKDIRLVSGENKFRIKQRDLNGPRYSDEYVFINPDPEVEILNDNFARKVQFSSVTHYELFNEYGVLITSGEADEFESSKLPVGTYYVNFGNTYEAFSITK